jgi:undecaprenyl-diphosphatase
MLNTLQAIILGLIQGFTELFPISSLGHSVILPGLFGWNIHQDASYFIVFLVATHLGTATVLFIFFWRDWLKIIQGIYRSFIAREIRADDTYAKLGWLLVIATIPAGLLGLLLQDPLRVLFASGRIAAAFLIVNGVILLGAERLRRQKPSIPTEQHGDTYIATLSWKNAILIGSVQAGALIPGISRSGSSMAGGLLAGLNNEDAARFSFLLATPLIAAAALLKLPELFQPQALPFLGSTIIGAVMAALGAYISVSFLVRYFKTGTLAVYAYYCLIAGAIFSLILTLRS